MIDMNSLNAFITHLLLSVSVVLSLSSCDALLPEAHPSEDILNEPIEELTPEQRAFHLHGDEEFGRTFSERDGLGPVFVSTSCESCHIADGKGHPLTTLTRFGRYDGARWDRMEYAGGPQLQHRAIAGYVPEVIPAHATGVSRFMPPAVTGLGYLEAVSDEDILALADPTDSDGDGVRGIPNYIAPPSYFVPRPHHIPMNGKYIGRFGKKAGAIDLLHQTVNAYKQDIGITSDFEPEDIYNPLGGELTVDKAADPEVSSATVNAVVFYIRTLKVPPRRKQSDSRILEGERLFKQVGCATCHVPTLKTGKSDIAALSEKTFHPFTDLLMHDMGIELDDGYVEGSAASSYWRTAPLWGIGLAARSQGGKPFYLHDGRARTLRDAIQYHGGEASGSRSRFNALNEQEKESLIRFLESL